MLIRQIEQFLRETGLPWTKFGRLAVRDPRFVEDLRNGRSPSERTEKRVEHFMNNYRETLRAQ
jgi:2,4-dienoyl-CoA reductase-like NADH-dependent reductase (Old Yellow Enzyme family)